MRPHALTPGGLLLGLVLLAALALAPAATAAPEDRDAICQGYRGTALWGQCTRAVDNGCHESEFANPLCLRWEAQWEAQTGALPPWLLACGIGSKCVFVTSETYTGNLGGLSGADAKCQALADAAGSLAAPGTYKAWLSTDAASPSTRFVRADVPYLLVNGSIVAYDYDELTAVRSGSIRSPISIDQLGDALDVTILQRVWTNTWTDGTPFDAPPSHCSDWTFDGSPAQRALIGNPTTTSPGWSEGSTANCAHPSRLYCFQQ